MLPERLAQLDRQAISADSETYLIRAGNLVPKMVLGSVAWWDGQEIQGALLTKDQTLQLFDEVLKDVEKILVGANIAFDLAVVVKEFAKRGYDIIPVICRALMGEHTEHMTGIHDGRVFDIQHCEALNAIAHGNLGKNPRTGEPLKGRYSQDTCAKLVLNRDDAKANDEYRLRYGEFDGWPLEKLPPVAQQYPVDDAKIAENVALSQAGFLPKLNSHHTWGADGTCQDCGSTGMGQPCWVKRPHLNMHDLAAQTATAFFLHMGAAWGFKIDQKYVDIIERHANQNYEDGIKPFVAAGIVRDNGTENRSELKRRVAVAYGSTGLCPVCMGTGKVASPANPKSKIICFKLGIDQVTREKTCDGTGLILSPDVPRSEKDGIGYGRSYLIDSGDEFLMDYAGLLEDMKTRKVYIPGLRTARLCVSCDHHGTEDDPHADGCVMSGWKDIPLTLRPNPILDTARVSYDGFVMLLPRKPGFIDEKTHEYIPSLRETFRARDGYGYSSEDFKAGETFTHAQSCIWLLGYSDLGNALLHDIDPHGAVAASVLGVSYQEWEKRKKEPLFKAARQAAKPFTFGKPTGMGTVKLVLGNRAQGPDTPAERGPSWIDDGTNTGKKIRGYKGTRFCILMNGSPTCGDVKVTSWGKRDKIPPTCRDCLEAADHLGRIWLRQWAENEPYYALNEMIQNDGMTITEEILERWPWLKKVYRPGMQTEPGQVMQHWSGRLRGGMDFTTICNGWFQVLLAEITKLAYRLVARECYDSSIKVPRQLFWNSRPSKYAGIRSPLHGSKPIAPFHDEIFLEHPLAMLHDGASRTSEVMRDVFAYICPDMAEKVGADPTIMNRWYKSAEELRDEQGRLKMWFPKIGPEAIIGVNG
jgi:hypothetical protein